MRNYLLVFLLLTSATVYAAHYKGFEIYHYLPADTWGAKDVLSMSEDRHGVTWIGTTKGLYEIKNTGKGYHTVPMPGLEQQAITLIHEDPNGILWICSREQGLLLRQKNHYAELDYAEYGFPATFKKNHNIVCASLPGGDMYVLNCPYLYRFHWRSKQLTLEQKLDIADPGLVQQMTFFPAKKALYLICKKKNNFHLYTINKTGLHKMDWPLYHYSTRGFAHSLGQYELDFLGYHNDSLLVSLRFDLTHQFPLFINHAKAFFSWDQQYPIQRLIPLWGIVKEYYFHSFFSEKPGIEAPELRLRKFFRAKQGYWCFATNQGLFIVKSQNQRDFEIVRSTKGENITSVVADGREYLWYSTSAGAYKYNLNNQTLHYNLQHKAIRAILPLRKDSAWIAYNNFEGLKMGFGKNLRMQALPFSQLYRHNFPSPPAWTPTGIWINSDSPSDLYCLHWPDARPLAFLKLKLNPSTNTINSNCANVLLWSQRDSCLWVGGTAGLYRIIKLLPNLLLAHQDTLSLPQNLRSLNVNALYEDLQGQIWIGTENQGLVMYNPKTNRVLKSVQPLNGWPYQRILCMVGSHQDTLLWVGTQNGLGCYNTYTQAFTNFSKTDGFPAGEFNVMAAAKAQDGNLYFGMTNGLLRFKPWVPKPHKYIGHPYVSIESQNTQGKLRWHNPDPFEKIYFKANETNLAFRLFINDITVASTVLFRYNISGLTNGWREQSGTERLFIPLLPPGNYQMQVQALLPDGSTSQVFSFYFHKNALWYKTAWFFMLLALLLIVLSYKFHQMRVKELEREHQLRKQVTADLHDNLSSRIYAMKVLSDRIADANALSPNLPILSDRLRTLSNDSLQTIRTFLWAFDPKNKSIKALFSKIERFTLQVINPIIETPVLLSFPVTQLNTTISPQVVHHVLMTIQELLINITKHTKPSSLSLEVKIIQKNLCFFIDNHLEQKPTAIHTIDENYGLEGIQHRLEKIAAELSFTQDEFAQHIVFSVPIH